MPQGGGSLKYINVFMYVCMYVCIHTYIRMYEGVCVCVCILYVYSYVFGVSRMRGRAAIWHLCGISRRACGISLGVLSRRALTRRALSRRDLSRRACTCSVSLGCVVALLPYQIVC
jgi:hypothetical protein